MINNHNDLFRMVLGIWLDFYCLYSHKEEKINV